MRALFLLFIFASMISATFAAPPATPCPYTTIGWAMQYPPSATITSVSYATDQQILYVVFNSTTVSAFSNVPIGIMQAFSATTNPLTIYNGSVVHAFHPIMLSTPSNCPLLNDDGVTPLWNY